LLSIQLFHLINSLISISIYYTSIYSHLIPITSSHISIFFSIISHVEAYYSHSQLITYSIVIIIISYSYSIIIYLFCSSTFVELNSLIYYYSHTLILYSLFSKVFTSIYSITMNSFAILFPLSHN